MNELSENIDYLTATEREIDPLVELWKQSLSFHSQLDERLSRDEHTTSKTRAYYKNEIESESAKIFLATMHAKTVGYLHAKVQEEKEVQRSSTIGEIDGLFVLEEYRRTGIGTHLYKLANNWWKTYEVQRIQLNVASRNSVGLSFWTSLGFKELIKRLDKEI